MNAFRTSSRATYSDSKSSDYSLASYQSPSKDDVGVAAADDSVAFDFDGEARQQTPSLVD